MRKDELKKNKRHTNKHPTHTPFPLTIRYIINSIYCRLYIVPFCGFLCTYRNCSLCIGTFGANIIVIIDINFIGVMVITEISIIMTSTTVWNVLSGMQTTRGHSKEVNDWGLGLMGYVFFLFAVI